MDPETHALQFEIADPRGIILEALNNMLLEKRRPSALELVAELRRTLGPDIEAFIPDAVDIISQCRYIPKADREYFQTLVQSGDLTRALRAPVGQDTDILSTIDVLVERSRIYRTSQAFRDMIDFIGRFRAYAPYNIMLGRLQNPSCSFFATAKDWHKRFKRTLKEDTRPMLILAPMDPVMLVYDLDQTEGKPVPEELLRFAKFEGTWNREWLKNGLENSKKYKLLVDFKHFSSTYGGFATLARELGDCKMRVGIHSELDEASGFGVLCHELAHIHLGHLGSDGDRWWPARARLDRSAMEVEAEAVAFIVTNRLGLKGSSAEYVSRHLHGGDVPVGVSVDMIAKTAGLIERMAREVLPAPKPRRKPDEKARNKR